MNKKIGFGVIGCGTISRHHTNAVMENADAKLVAVCDQNEGAAKELAGECGVKYYTDYRKMLEDKEIDAVSICTPSFLHPEQTIAAAQAGKHVLTEKPMAINLEDADRMIKSCKEANVKLGVIFQRRTQRAFKLIKKAVENNELGKLVLGDACMKYYRSQEYYDSAGWRGTWKFDGGGALMNQGIHFIDLLQWIMGPVDTVFAQAGALVRKIEVEDTSVTIVKFKNGAFGTITGTTSVFPPIQRLEIHGEKGSIIVNDEDITKWDMLGPDDKAISRLESIKSGAQNPGMDPKNIGKEGHSVQVADFVDAIKTGREPMTNGEEGRKSLALILAIYKSAKTGLPVKL
ncbi:MAG: hypothetical protein A3J83_06415 [Elusimicrobia bacterium RIFOXYA2_FULL_40_6]|nr:MAG: hypothetical protein A3J83_06415 [Elusimicrobia bacterium RIFOXYA2_FULL_40_6]